jgi:hypothetical protein
LDGWRRESERQPKEPCRAVRGCSAEDGLAAHKDQHGGKCSSRVVELFPDGKVNILGTQDHALPGGRPHALLFPAGEFELVALFSDGLATFKDCVIDKEGRRVNERAVATSKVVRELIGVKNLAGQFVQRRCRKAWKDTFFTNCWEHDDDVAVAMVAPKAVVAAPPKFEVNIPRPEPLRLPVAVSARQQARMDREDDVRAAADAAQRGPLAREPLEKLQR